MVRDASYAPRLPPALPSGGLSLASPLSPWRHEALAVLLTMGGAIALTYLAAAPALGLRMAVAALLTLLLVVLALVKPVNAVALCILWAPFLGLVRRLFDAAYGLPDLDPLLVVVPATLCAAFLATCLTRRHALAAIIRQSWLLRLVALLLVALALEGLNPLQGGLAIGLGGAIYRLIPLFVVIVVAATERRDLGPWLLRVIVAIGVGEALYGLHQTLQGFTAFEQLSIDESLLNGYLALDVNGVIRAFGTFVSSAEYVYYLDVAIGVSLAFAAAAWRQRRAGRAFLWWVASLVCVTAVILESHRGSLILMALVLLFVVAANQPSWRRALAVTVVGLLLAVVAQQHLPTALPGAGPLNTLLAHEFATVSGANALSDQSIQGHVQLVKDGLLGTLRNPLGLGLGAATQASAKFGGAQLSTEYDVTDMFVATGFIGGLAYLTLLAGLIGTAARLYRRGYRAEHLAAGAALVGGLGQMLGQGYYALGPTLLAVAGWIIAEAVRRAPPSHHRGEPLGGGTFQLARRRLASDPPASDY